VQPSACAGASHTMPAFCCPGLGISDTQVQAGVRIAHVMAGSPLCRKCTQPTCDRFQSERYLKKEMCGKCGWEDHPNYMAKCSNPECTSGLNVSEKYAKPELCGPCGERARSQRK
jgi:hypothetical protein